MKSSPRLCACVPETPPRASACSRVELLSKSRYLAGLQCERHLWLRVHCAELGTPPDAARRRLFDVGAELGRRARGLWPGGVLLHEEPSQFEAAAARTRALLADPRVPALFEAAFEHRGVRVRVDVLERRPDGSFALIEVKSGTSRKEVHLDDLAVQRFVLEGCGVRLASSELLLVDGGYVRGAAGIHWPRYFRREDLSEAVALRLPGVAAGIGAQHALLAGDDPAVEPGPHCRKPHLCAFWEHCTRAKPADWIVTLPYLGGGRLAELRAAGVERIADIPDGYGLSEQHARIRAACRSGALQLSPGLADALRWFKPPAAYLDFETASPAVPLYAHTRPYQRIVFQWSLHRVDARGRVTHRGFLADGRGDPRRDVAESLLSALRGADGPVVVWSHFEAEVLRELATLFPDLAPGLAGARARLADLLPVVRAHVYHADFRGSFSLKAVAPALVPGFGWSHEGACSGDAPEARGRAPTLPPRPADADIAHVHAGADTSAAFERLAGGDLSLPERRQLQRALQDYCRRDTEALLEVHRALLAASRAAAR